MAILFIFLFKKFFSYGYFKMDREVIINFAD